MANFKTFNGFTLKDEKARTDFETLKTKYLGLATDLLTGAENKEQNTTYLQTLIDNNTVVVIPDGEYYIGEITINSTSKCNELCGQSRKDTIIHCDGIKMYKVGLIEVPIAISPKIHSLTMIGESTQDALIFKGHNATLSDLYIKGYKTAIQSLIETTTEIVKCIFENIVVFNCVNGIMLNSPSHAINANVIKECFIVNCEGTGVNLHGSQNAITNCAIQGCKIGVELDGSKYCYSTSINNNYFENNNDCDIFVNNINSQYINGINITNNYHLSIVNGSKPHDVIKVNTENIRTIEIINNMNIDYYRNKDAFITNDMLMLWNKNDTDVIDNITYINTLKQVGHVTLEAKRKYQVIFTARKDTGNINTECVLTFTNDKGSVVNVSKPLSNLGVFETLASDIEVNATGNYRIVMNASELFYLADLKII